MTAAPREAGAVELPEVRRRGGKVIHGGWLNHRRTYLSWRGMLARCQNPKHVHFARYGGRGIVVSTRWQDFRNFLSDMGERPEGSTLDRIDNAGDYEPGNCRWAQGSQQQLNRSSNHYIEHNGERLTAKEWGDRLSMDPRTIVKRHRAGRPIDQVLRNRKRRVK